MLTPKTVVAKYLSAKDPEAEASALIETQKKKLDIYDPKGEWSYEVHARGGTRTHSFGLKKGPGAGRMDDAATITIGKEVGKEGWYVLYSWNGKGSEDKKAGFPQLVTKLKKVLNG